MATNRVAELRQVMDKFAEFYNQKLGETEDIPGEPVRIQVLFLINFLLHIYCLLLRRNVEFWNTM